MTKIRYDINVVDDEPGVLATHEALAEELIDDEVIDDFLLSNTDADEVIGTVSTSENAIKAVHNISRNYEKNPDLVQLVLTDYKMPDATKSIDKRTLLDIAAGNLQDVPTVVTGTELTDYLRWTFAGRRIGSLILTGFADDENVQTSREKGVYETLSKPIKYDSLVESAQRLCKTIFLRERPIKKQVDKDFYIRKVQDTAQLRDIFSLGYGVFDFMNYLQQKNPARLDIDKFSPYSTHYGIFTEDGNGREQAVAMIRIVGAEKQAAYADMIEEILGEANPKVTLLDTKMDPKKVNTLKDFISQDKDKDILVAESFDIEYLFDRCREQGLRWGEYSRIITHPEYRGYGLSKMAILTAIAHSRMEGPEVIFGACVPQHVPMYSKYGWKLVEDVGLTLETKVQQVARAMTANVLTDIPERYSTIVDDRIIPRLKKEGKVVYPFR